MVAFLVFCMVVLACVTVCVILCMSTTEAKLSATTAERDDLFHRLQQAEFDRDRLRVELNRSHESFDYFRAQVEKLNHDFSQCQGGK